MCPFLAKVALCVLYHIGRKGDDMVGSSITDGGDFRGSGVGRVLENKIMGLTWGSKEETHETASVCTMFTMGFSKKADTLAGGADEGVASEEPLGPSIFGVGAIREGERGKEVK